MAPHASWVILFDLGGVLVDVESVAAIQRLLGQTSTPGRGVAALAHSLCLGEHV